MDWFPQSEQGGFWQAQLEQSAKFPIQVMAGGPRIQTIPQVAAGEAEFGTAPADDVLIARMNGAPIRAIAAPIDHMPYTLMYHPGRSISKVSDLHGRTFAVSLGMTYWEWLKKTHGLTGERQIPVSGDLTLFRNDPQMVQQGVATVLPFRMAEAGIPARQFRLSDMGYRPYWVLFTTDEMLDKHRAVVHAAVLAVTKGWRDFLANQKPVDALILRTNGQMTSAILRNSDKMIVDELGPKDRTQIGCMTKARWRELADQLKQAKQLSPNFDETNAYDLAAVRGCHE